MDITWDDVVLLAPELVDFDDVDAQNLILAYVNDAFNTDSFKTASLKLARIYLAAHLATMSSQGGVGAAGPVISESAGGLSRTYADLASASGSFAGTPYADMLNWLIRTSKARYPFAVP